MEAKRDTIDRYVAAYLSERVGETFATRITGIAHFGLFATVEGVGGDGLLPVRDLGGEYFRFDEGARTLTGETYGAPLTTADPDRQLFSEADWNDDAIQEVREKGHRAGQRIKYRASKTMAERAAWEFVERNREKVVWDLVVLHPPLVIGPAIHDVNRPEELSESMQGWFQTIFQGTLEPKLLNTTG